MYSVQIRFLMTSRENDLSAGSHVRRKHLSTTKYVWTGATQAQEQKKGIFFSFVLCLCLRPYVVCVNRDNASTSTGEKEVLFVSRQTNKYIQFDWGDTLRLRMSLCLCLSHGACERPGTNTCTYISSWVVRVNQPLEVYSRSMQYMPRHCWWQLDLECNSKSLTLKLAQLVYRKFWFIYMWIKLISTWKDIEVSLALKQRRKATRNRHWEHALFLLFLFLSFLLLHRSDSRSQSPRLIQKFRKSTKYHDYMLTRLFALSKADVLCSAIGRVNALKR